MQHRDKTLLVKIINELDVALEMIRGKDFDTFDNDEILKRAMCMTVINIGELVKTLSDDFRIEHKQIPWKSIAGFRDIAAHKYQTLHMKDVYFTVTTEFAELKSKINNILSEK